MNTLKQELQKEKSRLQNRLAAVDLLLEEIRAVPVVAPAVASTMAAEAPRYRRTKMGADLVAAHMDELFPNGNKLHAREVASRGKRNGLKIRNWWSALERARVRGLVRSEGSGVGRVWFRA